MLKGLSTTSTLRSSRANTTILIKGKHSGNGLDRTLTEVSSNDDLITELEFTEALSGLSKDTPPGSDKVKYSDIKNLSVDNSDAKRQNPKSVRARHKPCGAPSTIKQ